MHTALLSQSQTHHTTPTDNYNLQPQQMTNEMKHTQNEACHFYFIFQLSSFWLSKQTII
jgi:hypothetical protein